MDEGKPKARAGAGGLKVARVGSLPRDAGLGPKAPGRTGGALQRERRLKLASGLLGACLLLGIGQIAEFYLLNFPPPATPGAYSAQLYDVDNGTLVYNATVAVANSTLVTQSNGEGNFTLIGLPAGTTRFTATKEGYTNTTYIVFITPSPSGRPPLVIDRLPLKACPADVNASCLPNATVDNTGARGPFVATCLSIIGIGIALSGLGLVATLSRRRYQHALLGGVGGFLAIGFFLGALLGLVAIFLLRGARQEFSDRRALFAPGEVPPLLEEEDDDGGEDGDDDDDDDGKDGEGDTKAPAKGDAPEAAKEAPPR